MSVWGKLGGAATGYVLGGPLGALVGGAIGHFVLDRANDPQVIFTIALIALAAKMAKADGTVSPAEVEAFYSILRVPPHEQRNVARVYRLAQEDVAGYDAYAAQVARIFAKDKQVLEDVLDALMHIAGSDRTEAGAPFHPREEKFLRHVAKIFKIGSARYAHIRARYCSDMEGDPYAILQVSPDADAATLRAAWRKQVRANHPDLLYARGVPPEVSHLSNLRMAKINKAWEQIRKTHDL